VNSILTNLGYVEIVLSLAALCFITVKRQWKDYWALGSFLAVRAACSGCLALDLHYAPSMSRHTAYIVYFYVYWSAFAIESLLGLAILYDVFGLTMAPLKGLRRLGMLLFRWAAVVVVGLTLASAFAPQVSGPRYMVSAIAQLQRTQSLLTLCLVLLVFLAIRSLGLSFGSKVVGVSVGLGLLAAIDLAQSAWLSPVHRMSSLSSVVNGVAVCATMAIWAAYFAMREPERREIVLPASSRWLRLDRMALAWVAEGRG